MSSMEQLEFYQLLFTDSFTGNLVVSTNVRYVLNIALSFWGYVCSVAGLFDVIIVSVCGYLCAISINFLIGKILLKICVLSKNHTLIERNNNYSNIVFKYNQLFLLLSLVPIVGRFVPLMAGFFRLKFIEVVWFCGLCDLCYCTAVICLNCKRLW
jgi:membrane protein YqaA with SNARE-associated domain